MSHTTPHEATIVIVDDDPNAYSATVELLELAGVKTVHARASGAGAMALLEELSQVDLFLVDIYLTGESGYDLLKQLRSHPKAADSKVVALTAGVMYDDIQRVKEAGFDGFIGKPVRPARLEDQVRRILAGESLWEWH